MNAGVIRRRGFDGGMEILLEAIGHVESPVTEAVDEDWGRVESEIVVEERYAAGLTGLDGFSHALVVFYMNKATFEPETHLVRRPQEREDMPLLGVFAQRAKHRPNPIGVTAVEVLNVKDNRLTVRGLDAIDGTPVLDVKPYFPIYDARGGANVPGWVSRLMEDYF